MPRGRFTAPGILPLNPADRLVGRPRLHAAAPAGLGRPANLAPIVLARIDTERSFFQLKDAVQEQVRGVIEAYWNLVGARTDVWAREQQVERAEFDFRQAEAEFRIGAEGWRRSGPGPHVRWPTSRRSLIAARANVLQSEAALRNILGLPPWDEARARPDHRADARPATSPTGRSWSSWPRSGGPT